MARFPLAALGALMLGLGVWGCSKEPAPSSTAPTATNESSKPTGGNEAGTKPPEAGAGTSASGTSGTGQTAGDGTAMVDNEERNPKLVKLIGQPLPDFTLKTIKGETISRANQKGKVMLLDFWATWCGPCRIASPGIQKLNDRYGSKGLTVVGVDVLEEGVKGTAEKYAKEHNYTYHFTEGGAADEFASKIGVEGLPAFVLVDQDGVIRQVWNGVPDANADELYAMIEQDLKPLIENSAAPKR